MYPPKDGPANRAFRDTLMCTGTPLYYNGSRVRWAAETLLQVHGTTSVGTRDVPGLVRELTHVEQIRYEEACRQESEACAAHAGDGQSWLHAD